MNQSNSTMPDTAEPGSALPDMAEPRPAPRIDRARYQLSLADVARRFMDAGVPRSEKTLRRYCTEGKLDAVQSEGPTSRQQWYVRESSIAPLIGELLQIHGRTEVGSAGHGAAQPDDVRVQFPENAQPANPRIAEPSPAQPDTAQPIPDREVAPRVIDRASDLDIYEHPYVKKLEHRIERLETRYEAQVRRTEEIQLKAQERLVELQRMTTIGQSKTLADFMLQAKNWLIGGDGDATKEGERAAQP